MGRPVVLAGVAEQASAGGWQADGVDEILQDAVLHVGEGVVVQRFLEEETDQWGFEGLISKLSQGLQDSSNSQVVVLGPQRTKKEVIFLKIAHYHTIMAFLCVSECNKLCKTSYDVNPHIAPNETTARSC